MKAKGKTLTVGVILDKRGDPPYVSVNKLWHETVDTISQRYNTVVYEVDSYFVENNDDYKAFVDKIDLLFLLSPYYTVDRTYKEFPVVFYGLGSMQKGGAWLADNHSTFRSCDKVILNCTSCVNIYDDLVKDQSLSRVMIPFGVDTDVFRPAADRSVLRQKYDIPEDAFIAVYAGRINHQKNPLMLLSALRDLRKKHDDLMFMFIGSFDDFYIPEFSENKAADIKEAFMSAVENFGLGSAVILFDTQNDTNKYAELLSLADIGINVTTLISENFGYTPVEMQACGLPVVGTAWGGLKDTITDEVTGFKIETVHSKFGARINFEQLKDRIGFLIAHSDARSKMSHSARLNAEKNYSLKEFAGNINDIIYDTYCDHNGGGQYYSDYTIDESLYSVSEKIHKKYENQERHVSWEHLHPDLDKEFYDMIASECADKKAEDTVWFGESLVSKGFDWEICGGKLVSYDSRWNSSFELSGCEISDDEMKLMSSIISGETVRSLEKRSGLSHDELTGTLCRLTDKGFIMPWNRSNTVRTSAAAVIIPHYSTGSRRELLWLRNALKSVEVQTDKDWKIIIVDDASPESSVKEFLRTISKEKPDRIETVFLRKNKGPGNARNIGILRASMLGCPFVLYLDSDDIASPERIEMTRNAFRTHPSVGVVYSSFDVIDENGRDVDDKNILPSIREIQEQLKAEPPQGRGVWRRIGIETGYINLTSSTSVRTSLALKYPFPQERVSEDYYTWLVYSASGWEYMYLDSLSTKYRIPQNKDGSRTRTLMGGDHMFNLRKSFVDVKGFQKALDLACNNGEISRGDKNRLMDAFLRKKAESMKKDGENEIAGKYIKKADSIRQMLLRAEQENINGLFTYEFSCGSRS